MYDPAALVECASAIQMLGISKYYGPLIIGALCATFFSGETTIMALFYLSLFPNDSIVLKTLIIGQWVLDVVQTALVWDALWFYIINSFGDISKLDVIPTSLALTLSLNSLSMLLVQLYYVSRIFHLSKRDYRLVVPIVLLLLFSFGLCNFNNAKMIHVKVYSALTTQFRWLVTLGLSLTCATDLIITGTLIRLLWMNRQQTLSLNGIINSLILYTFEFGFLTGCASLVVLICWLAVKDQMVFLAFLLSTRKFHAHSLIATLIMRHKLRREAEGTSSRSGQKRKSPFPFLNRDRHVSLSSARTPHVHISVSQSVQYDDSQKDSSID